MFAPYLALFLLFTDCVTANSKFDNEIVGIPDVACEADGIRVRVETSRPFDGRIFVRGEYHNGQCARSYVNGRTEVGSEWVGAREAGDQEDKTQEDLSDDKKSRLNKWEARGGISGFRSREKIKGFRESEKPISESQLKLFPGKKRPDGGSCPTFEEVCQPCECGRSRRHTNSIELVVPIGGCNTKRDRIINPPSLITSFVAVVSFHGSFITKIDRAYHIKCTYNETSFPVRTDLSITPGNKTDLKGEAAQSTCQYKLSDVSGNPVKHVRVGDLVRHEWVCDGPASARLLVHDCFVEGDEGIKQKVIDESGCSMDAIALPTPTYSSDGKSAWTDAFVFKFPDQTAVTFRCDMRTCHASDPDCAENTPPKCNIIRKKRSVRSERSSSTVHSRTLTVLDMDVATTESALSPLPPAKLCISIAEFGILVSMVTFILTSSAAVVAVQRFSRFD